MIIIAGVVVELAKRGTIGQIGIAPCPPLLIINAEIFVGVWSPTYGCSGSTDVDRKVVYSPFLRLKYVIM